VAFPATDYTHKPSQAKPYAHLLEEIVSSDPEEYQRDDLPRTPVLMRHLSGRAILGCSSTAMLGELPKSRLAI